MDTSNGANAVRVRFKSGHARYGLILDEREDDHNHDKHAWRFVSNENIAKYIQSKSNHLIEYLPGMTIVAIEETK